MGCLSDRRARWHKNCPLTVAIRARMTDAEAQWGAREQGAQSPLLRSHAWQRASLLKPARMTHDTRLVMVSLHICGVKPTVFGKLRVNEQVRGEETNHALNTCEAIPSFLRA